MLFRSGWVEYRAVGLSPPKAILEVTREYRDDEDPVEAWIVECCDTTDPAATTLFSVLSESRKTWLEANDPERNESPKAFALLLGQRGFKAGKDPATRGATRTGIALLPSLSSPQSGVRPKATLPADEFDGVLEAGVRDSDDDEFSFMRNI